jgi:hypothetical protein
MKMIIISSTLTNISHLPLISESKKFRKKKHQLREGFSAKREWITTLVSEQKWFCWDILLLFACLYVGMQHKSYKESGEKMYYVKESIYYAKEYETFFTQKKKIKKNNSIEQGKPPLYSVKQIVLLPWWWY